VIVLFGKRLVEWGSRRKQNFGHVMPLVKLEIYVVIYRGKCRCWVALILVLKHCSTKEFWEALRQSESIHCFGNVIRRMVGTGHSNMKAVWARHTHRCDHILRQTDTQFDLFILSVGSFKRLRSCSKVKWDRYGIICPTRHGLIRGLVHVVNIVYEGVSKSFRTES